MAISPWFVLLLGIGTVFLGLFSIILLTKLMSRVLAPKNSVPEKEKKAPEEELPTVEDKSQQPAACPIGDRGAFSAVIAAAIAEYMGTGVERLRIHSIRQIGTVPTPDADHGRFTAAVAAAIAETIGTDAEGLRIHSIRRLSALQNADQGRGRFVAAISAAIADSMGTDVSALRIRSIKRIS